MKRNISKDQILETFLDSLKDRGDIQRVNMREIARVLGCAHTNLYNYFSSYNDLLWEAHIAIQEKFIDELSVQLAKIEDNKTRLRIFFFTISSLYIDHKGWFRLAWLDYIDDMRPEKHKVATEKTVDTMVDVLVNIWSGTNKDIPNRENIHRVLHNVHCYIIGEVSNYINGRGLLPGEEELKNYIADTSVMFFTLCLQERGGLWENTKIN